MSATNFTSGLLHQRLIHILDALGACNVEDLSKTFQPRGTAGEQSSGSVVTPHGPRTCVDEGTDSSDSEDGFSIPFDPESFGLTLPKCSSEVCSSAVYSFKSIVSSMLGEAVQSLRSDFECV